MKNDDTERKKRRRGRLQQEVRAADSLELLEVLRSEPRGAPAPAPAGTASGLTKQQGQPARVPGSRSLPKQEWGANPSCDLLTGSCQGNRIVVTQASTYSMPLKQSSHLHPTPQEQLAALSLDTPYCDVAGVSEPFPLLPAWLPGCHTPLPMCPE